MIKLYDKGVYLVNGTEIMEDAAAVQQKTGQAVTQEEAATQTMAYNILKDHNTSGNMERLQIKFDKLTSHDITFVGIIQTARASGLEKFPVPYVLTNCHNSLCAVGGTINEDDHMFGLTCAKKYGGVYVPPHQAVIHQFAREMLAGGGRMILGSDSHTRYGALGTMAMGEGGPELVKQLLGKTYDIKMPGVIGIYLDGEPIKGVGPQDVALAIMKNTVVNMRRLLADVNDMQARGNLMWDSAMAENGILKVGRLTDFQAHQMEHQFGAYTDCNHGQGLAVIHPVYYRHIVKDAETKFEKFGKEVFGVDTAEAAVEALADFIKECGLPTKMGELK